MHEVKRSVLVPYTPEQMFALVADIEHYPQFVPWIVASTVVERTPGEIVGRLEMGHGILREQLTTRNVLTPPNRVDMRLVSGPFKELEGIWAFLPIADRGTSVEFQMRFSFANRLAGMLLSKAFETNCNQLVDAFVQQARKMYDKQKA